MYCIWTYSKSTSDTEDVLPINRKSTKEEEDHPYDCVRPSHKESELTVKNLKEISMENNYSFSIRTRNPLT